jgi:predicted GIY-YIG superfamily endonuclease
MSGFYVYICWDADRRPLYVGQTNNVKRRMKEHSGYSGWTRAVAFMSVIPAKTRAEAVAIEARQIGKLRPVNNVRHNPAGVTVEEAIAYQQWHTDFLDMNGYLFAEMAPREWRALSEEQREAFYVAWDCARHLVGAA